MTRWKRTRDTGHVSPDFLILCDTTFALNVTLYLFVFIPVGSLVFCTGAWEWLVMTERHTSFGDGWMMAQKERF
jgi:hypothetical protein